MTDLKSSKAAQDFDFFDFLHEIWKARGAFLAAVLVSVAAAGAIGFLSRPTVLKSQAADSSTVYRVSIPVAMSKSFDPYRRSIDELWYDLKSYLPRIEGLAIQDDNDIFPGTARPENIYNIHFSTYSGNLILIINTEKKEYASIIRNSFIEASTAQFENTLRQANSDIKLIEKTIINPIGLRSEFLLEELFLRKGFLSLEAVQDGTFRFFHFKPLVEFNDDADPSLGTGTSGFETMFRALSIGAFFGIVIGCIIVMFRIAIDRKAPRSSDGV